MSECPFCGCEPCLQVCVSWELKRLNAEVHRLREFAQLVETALEAEECNGVSYGNPKKTRITLNRTWFARARQLLEGE